MTAFVWATVTAVSPLRVRLDGDTTALAFTPDSLIDPATLVVSSRVRCELSERRLVIHGKAGGDFDLAVQQALGASVAALQTRPQGVVPSSVAVGSGSATVAADGTVTFTGCSSVSLNDVFDGLGGDMYEATINIFTVSAAMAPAYRLRAAGADNTTVAYDSQIAGAATTSALAQTYTSDNQVLIAAGSRQRHAGKITFMGPGQSVRTAAISVIGSVNNAGAFSVLMSRSLFHDVVAVYDGFTLIASVGNMTGYLKVVKIS